MIANKTPTEIDRAIGYLSARDGDTTELSTKDQEFIQRMIRLQALVLKYPGTKAIKIYERIFDVSQAQAYRDKNKMEFIFGNAKKTNRDFKRELSIIKLEMLEEMAMEQGDLRTAANIRMKLFDWSTKEENTAPFDPADINPPMIIVGEFPDKFKHSGVPKNEEDVKKLVDELRGKYDLSQVAEDIDFDEIKDGTEKGTS
jgi:hypothetical protein